MWLKIFWNYFLINFTAYDWLWLVCDFCMFRVYLLYLYNEFLILFNFYFGLNFTFWKLYISQIAKLKFLIILLTNQNAENLNFDNLNFFVAFFLISCIFTSRFTLDIFTIVLYWILILYLNLVWIKLFDSLIDQPSYHQQTIVIVLFWSKYDKYYQMFAINYHRVLSVF